MHDNSIQQRSQNFWLIPYLLLFCYSYCHVLVSGFFPFTFTAPFPLSKGDKQESEEGPNNYWWLPIYKAWCYVILYISSLLLFRIILWGRYFSTKVLEIFSKSHRLWWNPNLNPCPIFIPLYRDLICLFLFPLTKYRCPWSCVRCLSLWCLSSMSWAYMQMAPKYTS